MEDFTIVMSRRQLLQLVGALITSLLSSVTTGCSTSAAPDPPRPALDPDDAVRAQVRAWESRLIDRYDAAVERHPVLRGTLAPIRAQHAEHLASVSGRSQSPAASLPASSAATSSGANPGIVPADAAGAVRQLVAAERAAARAHAAECLRAAPPLAGLLASISASEAAHAAVLPALTGGAVRR